jgi:protein tyrosine/serine phosphatase
MARRAPLFLGCVLVLLVAGGPIGYSFYSQSHIRNLRMVNRDILYRSGQMSRSGLKAVIRDYGIKTVISLRDSVLANELPPDWVEEEFCTGEGIKYSRISPRVWLTPDGQMPAAEGVRQFLAIMDDPKNFPVLIHCYAGIHRSGAFTAVYRMEYQHWSNAQAITELRNNGYTALEDEWDLLGYLEQYVPRSSR